MLNQMRARGCKRCANRAVPYIMFPSETASSCRAFWTNLCVPELRSLHLHQMRVEERVRALQGQSLKLDELTENDGRTAHGHCHLMPKLFGRLNFKEGSLGGPGNRGQDTHRQESVQEVLMTGCCKPIVLQYCVSRFAYSSFPRSHSLLWLFIQDAVDSPDGLLAAAGGPCGLLRFTGLGRFCGGKSQFQNRFAAELLQPRVVCARTRGNHHCSRKPGFQARAQFSSEQ